MTTRQTIFETLHQKPQVDVLIIGAGANGSGTFRDLALQGVKVLLVEKDDFGAGASAGSSHMLHGGIRYLEYGEFRLVREALHERNLLLKNAPHNAKPLPTTIPIFRWFSGLFNAPMKFLNLIDRPSERGAVVIKLGLMMYDAFTGAQQTMPFHKMFAREESLKKRPNLNPNIVCTATYYDAWMPSPERMVWELIMDGENANPQAWALNYCRVVDGSGSTVTLRDELTGTIHLIEPKVVINAGGPWIDFVNQAMGQTTRFIGGTKGSHLILDHPELYEATGGHEIFFENNDGRIVLIFPYLGKVMVGTTDIRIDDPEQAYCTDDEVQYMLNLVSKVFPTIKVSPSQILFRFSGVRPLPSSDSSLTGAISRDHSIQSVPAGKGLNYPIHSLVGGKWTSFRAFSEQATDVTLQELGTNRRVSTQNLPIGGGDNYPIDETAKQSWLRELHQQTELSLEHLSLLFERYGTYAAKVALYISQANDAPLQNVPNYTRREILFLVEHEKIESLTDVLLRRTLIAMLGYAQADTLAEIAQLIGQAKGWSAEKIQQDIAQTQALLSKRHGISFAAINSNQASS